MSEGFESQKKKEMNKFKRCENPECPVEGGAINNPDENFCIECGAELPPGDDEGEKTQLLGVEAGSDDDI